MCKITRNIGLAKWATICSAAFAALLAAAAQAQQYSLTDLGTLGGTYSAGYAINAAGQVVGGSYTFKDVQFRPFLYDDGGMIDLGTLGGATSSASSINDAGQITGVSSTRNNGAQRAARLSAVLQPQRQSPQMWQSSDRSRPGAARCG